MAKVFQIVNGFCYWTTDFHSLDETVGKFPPDCKFAEAPDYVFEGWGYREEDDEGNPLTGDDRFIQPTPPEGFLYDPDSGTFYAESDIPRFLAQAQDEKQNKNKALLARYLEEHPLVWTDGKTYGCTMEDQTEIALNINQYQIQLAAGVENPTLQWHASKEPCTPWTIENLSALATAISQHVYPWFNKMNEYKSQIYAATTKQEVEAIRLDYSDRPPVEVEPGPQEEAEGDTHTDTPVDADPHADTEGAEE